MAIEVPTSQVKSIVNATFSDYRRKTVCIVTTGQCTLMDLNWSGGTRSEYRACMLPDETGRAHPIHARIDLHAPHPLDNKFEGKTVQVPDGCAIVQGGHFCGKVSRLYIYINSADFQRVIPQS